METLYGIGLGFIFNSLVFGVFCGVLTLIKNPDYYKMAVMLCITQLIIFAIGACFCIYALWIK